MHFGGGSLNTELLGQQVLDATDSPSFPADNAYEERHKESRELRSIADQGSQQSRKNSAPASQVPDALNALTLDPGWGRLSPWSRSTAKRAFDCACVIVAMPVLIPLILVVGAAVRFTSRGPVFFLQERMGRHGKPFTIVKFRTMVQAADRAHHPITTSDNQRFTLIGPFLRRWKLDELPQLANVLFGHMSLVGPRPKMREHVIFDLQCRPGITGMATSVFACEESVFARLPKNRLDAYYHAVVLPAKRQLDAEYMSQATFLSDIRLLVNSVLRRFDTSILEDLIVAAAFEIENGTGPSKVPEVARSIARMPIPAAAARPASAEHVSAF